MDTDTILADASAQIDWYAKLLKLAQLQHTLVEQERTDDLLVVLDRRSKILEQLTAIERRLRPIKTDWPAISATIDMPKRTAIEEKFAAARDLLEQITRSDQDDALLLQQRKIAVGQQLRQTTVAKQVNRGYAANAYTSTSGSRMDVKR